MIFPDLQNRLKKLFAILHSQFSIQCVRRGFSFVELILVVGILSGLMAYTVPAWRDYQIRSELHMATEQVRQAVGRAQILAQSGKKQMHWGFSVSHRTVFAGQSYSTRHSADDEVYAFPHTVVTSGMDEVIFEPLSGHPTATGTIVLTSSRGEKSQVNILIDREGIAIDLSDRLTICHCQGNGAHTLSIPESAWPAHGGHGDYMGACSQPNPAARCSR